MTESNTQAIEPQPAPEPIPVPAVDPVPAQPPEPIHEVNLQNYTDLALRDEVHPMVAAMRAAEFAGNPGVGFRLLHGAHALVQASAQYQNLIHRAIYDPKGPPLAPADLKNAMGDVTRAVALILAGIGCPLEEILLRDIRARKIAFPDAYTDVELDAPGFGQGCACGSGKDPLECECPIPEEQTHAETCAEVCDGSRKEGTHVTAPADETPAS